MNVLSVVIPAYNEETGIAQIIERTLSMTPRLPKVGVDGFELLKVANQCGTPALMLTAHGLSEENLKRSAEEGACYYAPKEKMHDIHIFVADVLEALDKKKSTWDRFFERLAGYYDKRFHGTNWREQEQEFWKKKIENFPNT